MDISGLVKQLIKAKENTDEVALLEILDALEQQNITIEVLKATKVGHIINKLRKFDHPNVQSKARELLRK